MYLWNTKKYKKCQHNLPQRQLSPINWPCRSLHPRDTHPLQFHLSQYSQTFSENLHLKTYIWNFLWKPSSENLLWKPPMKTFIWKPSFETLHKKPSDTFIWNPPQKPSEDLWKGLKARHSHYNPLYENLNLKPSSETLLKNPLKRSQARQSSHYNPTWANNAEAPLSQNPSPTSQNLNKIAYSASTHPPEQPTTGIEQNNQTKFEKRNPTIYIKLKSPLIQHVLENIVFTSSDVYS